MKSLWSHRRWLRRIAVFVSVSAVIGMGTPAPADQVFVCVASVSAVCDAPGEDVPFPLAETTCGPGSAGELARETIYGAGVKPIYVCDQDRAYEVGVSPGYVIGTDDVWVAVCC